MSFEATNSNSMNSEENSNANDTESTAGRSTENPVTPVKRRKNRPDDRPLRDKWVLVTGSSRGIGRAIAIDLAREGYSIVVHCRSNRSSADETVAQLSESGTAARVLEFDVADRAAARSTLEEDIGAHGMYYGVVCNAGITADGIFPMLGEQEWDNVIHTNLDAFYNVLHPLVMPLIKTRKPGRIVTIASVSGLVGNRGQVNYSAAKAGIMGATKALATELASRKITVNCVAPGLIDTDMAEGAPLAQMLQAIPAGRAGEPEEVAALVTFLMSARASYITRQVIAVNGGLC